MKIKYLNFVKSAFISVGLAFVFIACDPKEDSPSPVATGSVYVTCEGGFGASNGSVSVYDPKTNKVNIDPFNAKNNRSLGDIVQSLTLINDLAYIVVNNSNKVEIADASTFESKGVIEGVKLPRYLVKGSGNTAYLTEWVSFAGNGRVDVIDLSTNTLTKTIEVGLLPENLLLYGDKLFVSNSGDSTLTIINTATNVVSKTIKVGYSPTSIVKDANDKLWVICGGYKNYTNLSLSKPGALVQIDPTTESVIKTFSFTNAADSPEKLNINGSGNKLYYENGGVYSLEVSASSLPTQPLIARSFYGLGIDPNSETIYAATMGFVSNQKLIRYNASGVVLDSTEVGIGPNGFVFK